MDRNNKTYRVLNTGPNAPQLIPFYSKNIRHLRITNITNAPVLFDLYVEEGNMPTAAPPINEQFYLNRGTVIPPFVSLEYNEEDLYLTDRLPLYITPSVINAFSLIYRLQ